MLCKNTIESGSLELLIKLQGTDLLKDFHLAGGTSLALQIGHRISIDLDLFSQNDFDTNYLLEQLEQNFGFRLDYAAINTLKGSINDIKIDFVSHKYPFVKPPLEIEQISIFSIEDIAAMKLNAIAGNGTRSKDFIDIYFILKQFSVNEILEFYRIKYKTRNLMHIVKSLIYFEEINVQDWPVMIIENNLSLAHVKKTIEKQVKNFSKSMYE
jgi:hypothetical protein